MADEKWAQDFSLDLDLGDLFAQALHTEEGEFSTNETYPPTVKEVFKAAEMATQAQDNEGDKKTNKCVVSPPPNLPSKVFPVSPQPQVISNKKKPLSKSSSSMPLLEGQGKKKHNSPRKRSSSHQSLEERKKRWHDSSAGHSGAPNLLNLKTPGPTSSDVPSSGPTTSPAAVTSTADLQQMVRDSTKDVGLSRTSSVVIFIPPLIGEKVSIMQLSKPRCLAFLKGSLSTEEDRQLAQTVALVDRRDERNYYLIQFLARLSQEEWEDPAVLTRRLSHREQELARLQISSNAAIEKKDQQIQSLTKSNEEWAS